MATSIHPFITSVTLEGFLSFSYGAHGLVDFPLNQLNVAIGPNGSGKSNLVEAIALLRSAPRDLEATVRRGGGVASWLNHGSRPGLSDGREYGTPDRAARVEFVFGQGLAAQPEAQSPEVRYRLDFGDVAGRFTVLNERLEDAVSPGGEDEPYVYFGFDNGRPVLNAKDGRRELQRDQLDPTQSILAQRKDPDAYPVLTRLGAQLSRIPIYRDWQFGPSAGPRLSCRPDVRKDILTEALDNLPARLQELRRSPPLKRRLIEMLRELAPSFTGFEVLSDGGSLSLYLEEGDHLTPAQRLSDGTLRYLCLLTVLLDAAPPPMIVIEEPELGLHPDLHPRLAELLIDASERTQLLVTTHSDALVDALSGTPDAVLVCEKPEEASEVRRLRSEDLQPWLQKYRLGELWTRGELGGTRW